MIAWGLAQHVVGTTVHKFWVAKNIVTFVVDELIDPFEDSRFALYGELLLRALVHDLSKYAPDEALAFARTSGKLKATTYGTEEYKALLRQIKPAIERHYSRNPHHPEHHRDGVHGMSPADVIEMVADWGAAVRRHADGDLESSMPKNARRFHYNDNFDARLRGHARRMRLL